MSRPPNIVFVIADDETPAYHGCYGGPTTTPNIDRIARDDVLFKHSHGVAPRCNPSRYSIFTGQYPGRAPASSAHATTTEPYSIHQNADLEPGCTTLASLLREAGYFTGHIGKWHSNFKHLGEADEWPRHIGPDADLDDPAVDAAIRARHEQQLAVVRECGGFEWADAVHWGNLMPGRPATLQRHNPAWITGAALRFLDAAAARDRPFYLHVAHTVPHGPDPDRSLGHDHRYTPAGKLAEPPSSHPDDATVTDRLRNAGLQTSGPIAGINAGIVQIDDQIGILTRKLEAMGCLENTLFLYTADHGIHGKGTCYLGGFHLPLVARWPAQFPAGAEIEHAVSHADFLPTLCAAARARIPGGYTCDGRSWLGLARGIESGPTRPFTYQEMGVARAVTAGRWRYVTLRYPESILARMASGDFAEPPSLHAYEESHFCDYNFVNKPAYFDPEQLYDLETDPFERRNLARDPACAETLSDLREKLFSVTDSLPGPYRHDIPPFQLGPRYRRLVEVRRLRVAQKRFHPHGFDQEKVYNLNLPDPA